MGYKSKVLWNTNAYIIVNNFVEKNASQLVINRGYTAYLDKYQEYNSETVQTESISQIASEQPQTLKLLLLGLVSRQQSNAQVGYVPLLNIIPFSGLNILTS